MVNYILLMNCLVEHKN